MNNHAELLALKHLLKLDLDQSITKLQVYGDSEVIINWMKGIYEMENMLLHPILDMVKGMVLCFTDVTFHHVYYEMNSQVDKLSNVLLLMGDNTGCISELQEDSLSVQS